MRYNYIDFQPETPPEILSQNKDCKPFRLKSPIASNWKESKERILIVLQHVDSEDLKTHRLLTGPAKHVIDNVFKMAENYAHPHGYNKDYALAVVSFNYFKTYTLKDNATLREADKASAKRVLAFIKKYKPTKVMVFGDDAAKALLPKTDDLRMLRGHKHERSGVKPGIWTTIDFTKAYSRKLNEDGENDEQQDKVMDYANLLGFISRNVANCLHGKILHKVEVKARPVMINTIPKFKKLLRALEKKKRFAYDTETTGLERVLNLVLTMQFAFDALKAYIVPLHHKDTPFTKKELKYIESKMKSFWAKYEDPLDTDYDRYYIGQNLKFDNTVSRQQFGVYTIKRRMWDLMAGEYTLDENMKGLMNYRDKSVDAGIYSLLQIELNYGFRGHLDGDFKKGDAATIVDRDLNDKDLLKYMALDVQVPFAIHEKQIERARKIKHLNGTYEKDFKRFVLTQMNNMIHIQSIMEHRGSATDIPWLEKLNEKHGPLQIARAETRKKLFAMPSVKEASRRLRKKRGAPEGNLFSGVKGVDKDRVKIDLNKQDHKIMLFIEVMKLKPIEYGKDGTKPSINKAFQIIYKEKEEVALFSDLSAVEKLRGTYVKGFLKKLRNDKDYKHDHKLRPSFGFTDTVTGRSNSFGPNLQQIPTRGIYAKHIKKIFAAELGRLKIKMDYSAHEVRVWSIISKDKLLGALFNPGREFRQKYRKTGDENCKILMDTQGDIHIQNVCFFFGKNLKDIKKVKTVDKAGKEKWAFPEEIAQMRDAVKSIVFGAIYGRGAGSIAMQTGREKKYIEGLLKKFFPRFPKASKWLEDAKAMPLTHNYVYSPIGRRRNLYAHLFGIDQFSAAVERRGCNSPVQGLAADMGHTAAYLFGIYYEKFLKDHAAHLLTKGLDIGNIEVMVHDSIDGDFPYELYYIAVQIMQWCATIGCMQYYRKHFGLKFTTYLEVEFEMGADSSSLMKWDWSEKNLKTVVQAGLEKQKERFPDMDTEEMSKRVFKITKDKKVMKYLDKNFPVLGNAPELITQ